jgi:metal-responsive CopG/Arc/MetJ family transcriptional regulator
MRTLVDIPEDDVRALDEIGRRRRVSRARVIRAALSEYLDRNAASHQNEAFGLWGEGGEDGVEYQKRIRAEW